MILLRTLPRDTISPRVGRNLTKTLRELLEGNKVRGNMKNYCTEETSQLSNMNYTSTL